MVFTIISKPQIGSFQFLLLVKFYCIAKCFHDLTPLNLQSGLKKKKTHTHK